MANKPKDVFCENCGNLCDNLKTCDCCNLELCSNCFTNTDCKESGFVFQDKHVQNDDDIVGGM